MTMTYGEWALWALILIIQNVSFTFVSRARNSGSLKRHIYASIASNGVWFASQSIMFTKVMPLLQGQLGWAYFIGAMTFYNLFTVGGATAGHFFSLATEKGSSAVGANKRYAQIPVEEWERVKTLMAWDRNDVTS